MLTILTGDALTKLRELPDESVQCCVTSPPYWGLRDYGTASWEGGDDGCDHKQPPKGGHGEKSLIGKWERDIEIMSSQQYFRDCGKCGAKRIDSQLGLEKTPKEYVAKMVEVFREVRRVLRRDGTLWLNLGDSYCNAGSSRNGEGLDGTQRGGAKGEELGYKKRDPRYALREQGIKHKDLIGIPWMVAFALQSDGWYLRQDIIWAKPNPMPESVTDRCTKSHEYLFLLTKSARYFYDAEAIKERSTWFEERPSGMERNAESYRAKIHPEKSGSNGTSFKGHSGNMKADGTPISGDTRNKRSVWTVATAPYPEAHFATYPPDLIKPCIMAGTSAKGCCAKCGAPWERIVKASGGTIGRSWHNHERDLEQGQRAENAAKGGHGYKVETLGWQPTCKCDGKPETVYEIGVGGGVDIAKHFRTTGNGSANVMPCTVLDPFAGSGTTGAVAIELGRKAVLIELNPKYVELIEQRCNVTVGLPL